MHLPIIPVHTEKNVVDVNAAKSQTTNAAKERNAALVRKIAARQKIPAAKTGNAPVILGSVALQRRSKEKRNLVVNK
jgi:hypothetical protein